jgi:hypothetical protein
VRVAQGHDEVDRVLDRGQGIYMRHRWTGQRASLIDSIAGVLTARPASARVESHTDAVAR